MWFNNFFKFLFYHRVTFKLFTKVWNNITQKMIPVSQWNNSLFLSYEWNNSKHEMSDVFLNSLWNERNVECYVKLNPVSMSYVKFTPDVNIFLSAVWNKSQHDLCSTSTLRELIPRRESCFSLTCETTSMQLICVWNPKSNLNHRINHNVLCLKCSVA